MSEPRHRPRPGPRLKAHQRDRALQRHEYGDSAPAEPYPFIFSFDPLEERRFAAPGQPYGPARNRLPRAAALAAWVIVILLVGGGLISLIVQLVGR